MIDTALSGAGLREALGGEKRRMLHLYVCRPPACSICLPRAIPHNVQKRKEEVTILHVRFPQYERLHTFCLPFTCRAARCLTDPDKLIPWAVGEQPLEWALTLMPDGPSQTVCWFFFSR